MELLHAALLFASLSLFFLLFKSKSINLGSTLPPGPTGFPIIGSIHHLLRRWPPHRALRDLAMTHGPLMHLRLGQLPLIVVSSPEIAREIMKTHDAVFATRPQTIATKITSYGGLDLIFAPYGEHWRQLRKLCVLELLSAKRVQSFRSIREEEVCNLVRSIGSMSSSSLPVNISEMISRLTNNITARATLGSRCKDQDRYLEALKEGSRLLSGFMLVDLFPGSTLVRLISRVEHKIERWHRKMDEILDGIVKERRERREMKDGIHHGEQTPDNFLDVLLRQQEQGGELGFPITTDIIKAIISILDKGELQVAGKERESQLSNQFRDIATIVMQKTINPETQRPYTISMIERLMHEIHFAVDPHNSSKKQALEVIHELQKHFPIKRAPMKLRLIVPEKNFCSLMEKLNGWNASIASKDESGNQPSVVCDIEPGLFRDCDALMRNLQGRVEILSVSVHVEGDSQVDLYEDAEYLPSRPESNSVVQLGEGFRKHNISTENSGGEEQVKQSKCSTCDAIVGDATQYREHFKSEWHKHNLKRKTRQLPPLSAEECTTDVEMGDFKADLKEYSF